MGIGMMNRLFLSAVFVLAAALPCHAEIERLLYLTSPDGAQFEGGSGENILVFDIDAGFKLVKRIPMPAFKNGVRGFCANAKTHCAYYSTSGGRIGAWDLESGKTVWERTMEFGVDRAAVTPDGRKIYAPTGWWVKGRESCWMVLDASDGKETGRIMVADQSHNTIASLDGKFAYLGSFAEFRQVSTADDSVTKLVTGVGDGVVFPFTVNRANTLAYICMGSHVGFEVVDLKEGKIQHRVFAGTASMERRTHGCGLTPDERELWISDQAASKLWIFDATQSPPVPAGSLDLSMSGHGWITFTIDGHYALTHTPDIIDVKTRKIVARLTDEHGKPVASSKFIEVHKKDGKVVAVGDQFGIGRKP